MIRATYPDPHDTDPSTRDTLDLRESPVGVRGNDRGDELGNAESTHQGERGTFHEEESVRTRDEDQSLRDDSDLKVHNHVKLRIVDGDLASGRLEADTKLPLEEA